MVVWYYDMACAKLLKKTVRKLEGIIIQVSVKWMMIDEIRLRVMVGYFIMVMMECGIIACVSSFLACHASFGGPSTTEFQQCVIISLSDNNFRGMQSDDDDDSLSNAHLLLLLFTKHQSPTHQLFLKKYRLYGFV